MKTETMQIVDAVTEILKTYDPVTQQKVIEILTVIHCSRVTDREIFVADAINKHVKQLLDEISSHRSERK